MKHIQRTIKRVQSSEEFEIKEFDIGGVFVIRQALNGEDI